MKNNKIFKLIKFFLNNSKLSKFNNKKLMFKINYINYNLKKNRPKKCFNIIKKIIKNFNKDKNQILI